MKNAILLAAILSVATLVAAQNTVIVIDNQTASNVTVKCEDNVCTVSIKQLATSQGNDCNSRIPLGLNAWGETALFCLDWSNTTVTQQPHVAVQPYYISQGPYIYHFDSKGNFK